MKVVIVGGGFGGLSAAKALTSNEVDVTLIDSTNHHLFQPLLYQVATAALSSGELRLLANNCPGQAEYSCCDERGHRRRPSGPYVQVERRPGIGDSQ